MIRRFREGLPCGRMPCLKVAEEKAVALLGALQVAEEKGVLMEQLAGAS